MPHADRSTSCRVLVTDGRAGIPFVIDSVSGKPGSFRPALLLAQNPFFTHAPAPPDLGAIVSFARRLGINIGPNATELDLGPKITMGFCGKNIEAAGQLLMEADRGPNCRVLKAMRKRTGRLDRTWSEWDRLRSTRATEGYPLCG